MTEYFYIIFFMIPSVIIYCVWILRSGIQTPYRGGDSKTLKEEFQTYGLSTSVFYIIGASKLIAATLMLLYPINLIYVLAGFNDKKIIAIVHEPPLTLMPLLMFLSFSGVSLLFILMCGAMFFHFKVRDPIVKIMPAALVSILCVL